MLLEGIFPVVAVPFTESGEIHYDDFEALVSHLNETGIQGQILFGIASEFHKLSGQEKANLVSIFLKTRGKSLRFLSVTEHSTELAVKMARDYQKQGADGLMIFPPFFLNPSSLQLKEHITAVLKAVDIPVILQYAPHETNCPFTMEDMCHLGKKFPHLVYKIESPNPMKEINELLLLRPSSVIFNGYAGIHMFSVLECGGKGIIPGCSFAEIYVDIYQKYQLGQKKEAQNLHARLKRFIDVWMGHVEYIIQAEKSILQARGLISTPYCRKPSSQKAVDGKQIEMFLEEFPKLRRDDGSGI